MEKRGLSEQLKETDAGAQGEVCWADEMRVGLIGQVRRRWVPRGFKLVQQLQFVYEWEYLDLAVNPLTGDLYWAWTENLKSASLAPVVRSWQDHGIGVVIWDGARGHRGTAYEDLSIVRIIQPAYSPELNPVERIFEYLRDRVEGHVYASLADKRAALELHLRQLAADPAAVRRLAGWQWIREQLAARAA